MRDYREFEKRAKSDFFMQRLSLGHFKPAQIQSALETAGYLSEEQKSRVRQSLANLEIIEIMASLDRKSESSLQQAGERMVAMKKAGRNPSGRMAGPFWQVILAYADENEAPKLFEEALTQIKKNSGKNMPEKWLIRMEARLKLLKGFAKRRR